MTNKGVSQEQLENLCDIHLGVPGGTLEPEEWSAVLKEFEKIGYCCFTPHLNQ